MTVAPDRSRGPRGLLRHAACVEVRDRLSAACNFSVAGVTAARLAIDSLSRATGDEQQSQLRAASADRALRGRALAALFLSEAAAIRRFTQRIARSAEAAAQTVSEVYVQAARLHSLAGDIARASLAAGHLAINAEIGATRLGNDGRVVRVIATTMRELAANIGGANERLQGYSRQIAQETEKLTGAIESANTCASEFVDATANRLPEAERSLDALSNRIGNTLLERQQAEQRMESALRAAGQNLRAHDEVDAAITGILNEFAARAAGDDDGEWPAAAWVGRFEACIDRSVGCVRPVVDALDVINRAAAAHQIALADLGGMLQGGAETNVTVQLAAQAEAARSFSTQTIASLAEQCELAAGARRIVLAMGRQLEAMSSLATECSMLGSAARIEAAVMGSGGNGFATIAQGMVELAQRIDGLLRDAAHPTATLEEQLATLVSTLSSTREAALAEAPALERGMFEIARAAEDVSAGQTNELELAKKAAARTLAQSFATIETLQFQDRYSQELRAIGRLVEECGHSLARMPWSDASFSDAEAEVAKLRGIPRFLETRRDERSGSGDLEGGEMLLF
jgi:hypothetical protein